MDVAKLMRLQSMLGAVLAEVHLVTAEDAAGTVAEVTRRTVVEVGSALPDVDLRELATLVGELDGTLTIGESRVVDAQLLGWLDGLALQQRWEDVSAEIEAELTRLRRARADASFEDRRRARALL